jgi:hypothetical protein
MKNVLWLATIAACTAALVLMWHSFSSRAQGSCRAATSECQYDLNALKKTDTNLLVRAGVSYIKPGMSNLTALAVDGDDNIIVGSRTGVEVLDARGERVTAFDVGSPVNCLAAVSDGDILAGMKDHIEVYSRGGERKAVWKSPDPKTELTSIAVSRDYVFAADYVNRLVWRFDHTGKLLGRIGDMDSRQRKSGFVVPSAFFDVAIAGDGSLWVANPGEHRLEHFTADGKLLTFWGKASTDAAGFCGCCNPSNIAIMPDGSIVTSEKHIVRVKIYGAAGELKGIVCGQEDWQEEAVGLDLAVDANERILVLDPQADVVRVYSRQ